MSDTKRLLALDGGGIRGVLSIEILAALEAHLREREQRPDLVLADYFDYIGGTSTGAILAACLSLGMPVERVRRLYHDQGSLMFTRAALYRRLQYGYDAEPLAAKLREELGEAVTLGDAALQTYLLLVLRNATTDSPWPLSNNPRAKYNDRKRSDCNLRLPLWQLVRASAAAPIYFPPEVIRFDQDTEFAFVDGGVTSYNNPAFMLFLMATLGPYKLEWPTGEDRMLLVSVGTGRTTLLSSMTAHGPNLIGSAMTLPLALISSAAQQQDLLCRAFGRCLTGPHLDGELGDLVDLSQLGSSIDGPTDRKLFTYLRYDADLTTKGMKELGLDLDPAPLHALDAVDRIPELSQVGQAVGKLAIKPEHLARFPVRNERKGPNVR